MTDQHPRAGARAKGLATYALGLARRPEFGSVRVSKTALPERMADLILDDLRERGTDEVGADRPIAAMLVSVFRVT